MRDWRAGELTMLVIALVLAVAALASVGFLADRLQQGLERDARRMIAADFVVRSDHPVDAAFFDEARALGLHTATTAIFPSMVARMSSSTGSGSGSGSGDNDQALASARLAAVKAVSAAYPLRGALRIAPAPDAPDRPAQGIPAKGTVWVDRQLLETLHAKVGDAVQLGERGFTIGAVITRELDRGFAFVNFSPRVMVRAD